MLEAEWQQQVLDVARLGGWLAYHTHDSRHSERGWPDVALLRPPRLVVAELKVGRRQVTPEQRVWLDELARVPGVESYVWRPADLAEVCFILGVQVVVERPVEARWTRGGRTRFSR